MAFWFFILIISSTVSEQSTSEPLIMKTHKDLKVWKIEKTCHAELVSASK